MSTLSWIKLTICWIKLSVNSKLSQLAWKVYQLKSQIQQRILCFRLNIFSTSTKSVVKFKLENCYSLNYDKSSVPQWRRKRDLVTLGWTMQEKWLGIWKFMKLWERWFFLKDITCHTVKSRRIFFSNVVRQGFFVSQENYIEGQLTCNIFLLGSLLICWVVVWKPITNLFVKGKAINICCLQENFVFRKQQTFYPVQPKYPPVHPMKNEDNDGYQFQYEYLIKT